MQTQQDWVVQFQQKVEEIVNDMFDARKLLAIATDKGYANNPEGFEVVGFHAQQVMYAMATLNELDEVLKAEAAPGVTHQANLTNMI